MWVENTTVYFIVVYSLFNWVIGLNPRKLPTYIIQIEDFKKIITKEIDSVNWNNKNSNK